MTPPPHPRLGPRPLPLHLAIAATSWLGLANASAISSGVWPGSKQSDRQLLALLLATLAQWRPALAARAAGLAEAADAVPAEALTRAVGAEARRRLSALATGIAAYRRHPYRRTLTEPPALWQEGSTRLLDYGAVAGGAAAGGPPLLVVPSLINRAYVLDLTAEKSLLRWLAAQGLRPLLVDWGAPPAAPPGGSRRACWAIAWAGCWQRRWRRDGSATSARWSRWPRRGTSTPSGPSRRN
jgi:polyhydroxyalkanoate synthase